MWTLPDLTLGVAFMIVSALVVLVGATLVISGLAFIVGRRMSPRS